MLFTTPKCLRGCVGHSFAGMNCAMPHLAAILSIYFQSYSDANRWVLELKLSLFLCLFAVYNSICTSQLKLFCYRELNAILGYTENIRLCEQNGLSYFVKTLLEDFVG